MDLYHHLRHLTLTRRLVISLVVAVIVGFYTLPSGPSLEASSVRCTTPRNDILSPGLLLLNLSHPFKTHYSPLFLSQAAFSDSDSLPEAKANPNLLLSLYLDWRSQSGIQRTNGWDWEGGPEDVEGVSVEMEEMVGSLGEEVDGIFSEERVRESLGWVRGSIIREGEEEGDGMESEGWIWPDGMGEEALYSPPLPESSVLSPHNLSPLRTRTILYLSTPTVSLHLRTLCSYFHAPVRTIPLSSHSSSASSAGEDGEEMTVCELPHSKLRLLSLPLPIPLLAPPSPLLPGIEEHLHRRIRPFIGRVLGKEFRKTTPDVIVLSASEEDLDLLQDARLPPPLLELVWEEEGVRRMWNSSSSEEEEGEGGEEGWELVDRLPDPNQYLGHPMSLSPDHLLSYTLALKFTLHSLQRAFPSSTLSILLTPRHQSPLPIAQGATEKEQDEAWSVGVRSHQMREAEKAVCEDLRKMWMDGGGVQCLDVGGMIEGYEGVFRKVKQDAEWGQGERVEERFNPSGVLLIQSSLELLYRRVAGSRWWGWMDRLRVD